MYKKLYLDIGNSTIDLLCSDNKRLKMDKSDISSFEEYLSANPVSKAYISSVNSRTEKMITSVLEKLNVEYSLLDVPMMRKASESLGLIINNLVILGSDLFCDIMGTGLSSSFIVADLGTAGKILAVDKSGTFLGGAIFPGLSSFPLALSKSAPALGSTIIEEEPPLLSLKTDECVSSGSINGVLYILEGYVKRIREIEGMKYAPLFLQGGSIKILENKMKDIDLEPYVVNLDLSLVGLRRAMDIIERNKEVEKTRKQS